MNKKRLLILISSLFLIAIITLIIVFYPKYVEKKNIEKLDNEIKMVNNYFSNNEELTKINDYLKENITSSNIVEVERSLENYINDLIGEYNELKDIVSSNKTSIDKINKEELTSLNKKKELLLEKSNKFDSIITSKSAYYKEKDYQELYNELSDKIVVDYQSLMASTSNIDKEIEAMEFLNNNSNWKVENDKVIFRKRSSFDEYNKLNNDVFNYELISDKEGPVITASNLTIIKGNKINLNDKVKCVDAVDDRVDCKIEGSYDINKIGTYNLLISAKDKANNKSSKSIKLTVKEEKKNPYYVEVIRNQNVVVVYGLDGNNEYTKIVKVFLCSVGKDSSKTPTGTFKTSDKSSWGSLVGGVYGQYYTRIVGSILFHSVPYYKKDKSTLEWEEYNKLGSPASKGCVRLAVRDVKWLYDNCPRGTTVKIYDGKLPSGVSKPSGIKIDGESPNKGWDPTDPDRRNPWKG